MSADNPILNSPYDEPQKHYAIDPEGDLKNSDIMKRELIALRADFF